jgi:type IV pilus assembly protein PilO
MTSNSRFEKFLDERYIPLAPRTKVLLTVALLLLPLVAFYFAYYQPKEQQTQQLLGRKSTLEQELNEVKLRAADLAKFEQELAAAEELYQQAAILLPKDKEIPQLLRDISALGRSANLDFLTFTPLADIPKDFYAEIPVTIDVRGPYHNVGYFFDQVSKLERIVSVSNVKMSAPKKEGAEMFLNSDCRLVTYRFTNVELPKEPKK